MSGNCSNVETEPELLEGVQRIRAAIEVEHDALLRSVMLLVVKTERRHRWSDAREIASEILQNAVQEALNHADQFDVTRSATAWVRGIAARLLLNRHRAEARNRRCVSASVLGDDAWAAALEQMSTDPTDTSIACRLDLKQALNRISESEQKAIELRYFQGLDGQELADALGVSTPGAARVRLCRALQSLRVQFVPAAKEVIP